MKPASDDSDSIYAKIEAIAATPGKNDKQALLKAADSALLRRVLKAACEPTWSYGVKQLPNRASLTSGGAQFNDATWRMLHDLRARRLTGSAMKAALAFEFDRLSLPSSELLRRILLKDLRAGFAENSTNKVFPGLVGSYPYMRCCLPSDTDLSKFPWADGVISQEKADGMFFNVNHEDDGEVVLSSRAGSVFPSEPFEQLIADIGATFPRGTQTHGEVLVYKNGVACAREVGNGILNSALKGGGFGEGEQPVLFAWDQIPLGAVVPKGRHEVPYRQRLAALVTQIRDARLGRKLFSVQLIPTRIVHALPDAYAHYGQMLEHGKEGVVLKKPTAIWRDGDSLEQVKLKLEFVIDLEVLEIVPGKANKKNAERAGSLRCATSCAALHVDVAVKNEAMRAEVDANPQDWIGKIVKVKSTGVLHPSASNPQHTLFLPRMVEAAYRIDKHSADDLASVFAQQEAAKRGAAVAS